MEGERVLLADIRPGEKFRFRPNGSLCKCLEDGRTYRMEMIPGTVYMMSNLGLPVWRETCTEPSGQHRNH